MSRRWALAAAGLISVAILVWILLLRTGDDFPDPVPPPQVPLPSSIAAIGDSITAGVGASPDRFQVSPENTWTTGDADDDVTSHYERLLAAGAPIAGRNDNFAIPGANMADGPDQARRTVAAGAAYVTILLGANDVCTSSIETMTPLDDFERDFRATLDILVSGLPQARLFVVSVPDVQRLWETFQDSAVARQVWQAAGTCGALLDPANTQSERDAARARNLAFNEILARVCSEKPLCHFDQNAVFAYAFTREEVAIDFFHPSHEGHRTLAELTWRYGYWPDM